MATGTITPEQKAEAAKAAKAEKERARREQIKQAKVALEKAGLDPGVKLDTEQRERATSAPAGLTGKALSAFILEGKGSREQAEEARNGRQTAERKERVTRASKDPEAAALAADAKALAEKSGIKSAFRPAQARQLLEMVGRKDPVEFSGLSKAALEKFAEKPDALEADALKEARAQMRELGSGTRLWGRKLAIFLVALSRR